MRPAIILLLSFVFSSNVSAQVVSTPKGNLTAKFLPPQNKVLLFIGQDRESINTYAREMNVLPVGVMFYTSIQTLSGIDEPADHGAGFQDAQYLLREYPDAPFQIGLYLVGTLQNIIDGKYDENIARFGEWMKEARRPIFLRIGYEFDLPQNEYEPQLYKQAFRYLVDHWRAQGVANVAYVWHSYGVVDSKKHFMQWYPGDEYVDWFGLSFFSIYNENDNHVFAQLSQQYAKPLMIAEASPNSEMTTDGKKRWERWYEKLFSFCRLYDVRVISYINCEWDKFPMWKGHGWGDSRLEKDPFLMSSWITEINSDRYLKSSTAIFKVLSP